ncbi:MAG: hypothetical protein ACI33J_06635 [Clostridium sp.]|nr:hypothetical protein [Clostridium sp.]
MGSKKKDFSLKTAYNIAKIEYIKWLFNPRLTIIIMMFIFIKDSAIDPLIEHANKMNKPINIIEPFIAIGNSKMMLLLIPAIFITLMSDFPKTDGNTIFVISRSGRKNWFIGQIFFNIFSIFTYLFIVFIGCVFLSFKKGKVSNSWSEVITKYNKNFPEDSHSFASELIDGRLYNQMTPLNALVNTMLLIGLYLFVFSLILLLFYLMDKKFIGILINIIIMAIGTALTFIELDIMWITPLANSIIWLHYTEFYSEYIVPVVQSYIYFFLVTLFLIGISIHFLKKYNFINISEID